MNTIVLASKSTVGVVVPDEPKPYVLRCFEEGCTWGTSIDGTWADVLDAGISHEREHQGTGLDAPHAWLAGVGGNH